MENHADLTAIALVMTIAVLCGLILTGLRQPAIVGYILAGVVLGPSGLGLVQNNEPVRVLAELGVLMLLFIVGMELSLRAFKSIYRIAIGCAALQIALALGVTMLAGWLLKWSLEERVLLGFVVAMSSTAVAIKILEDIGELRTPVGRLTVGVLIGQDLAVAPMLLLINSLGRETGLDYTVFVKLVLAAAVLGFFVWYLSRRERIHLPFGSYLRARAEIGPLAVLAFCFVIATVFGLMGLSSAYGAFLAGLIIGSSAERSIVLRTTLPIQSVLLVMFFLSVGLLFDLQFIWENLGSVLLMLALVTFGKTVANIGILRLLREPWERAFPAGVVMGQIGEFSFVLAAAGFAANAIDFDGYRLAIAVIALSLIISPLWLITARRFHDLAQNRTVDLGGLLKGVYAGEIRFVELAVNWARMRGLRMPEGTIAPATAPRDADLRCPPEVADEGENGKAPEVEIIPPPAKPDPDGSPAR